MLDLTYEQIKENFEAECGSFQHTIYSRHAWREAVAQDDTILGYWDWAFHQYVNEDADDSDFDPADNGNQGS